MNDAEILVVGANEEILNIILRLINQKENWKATGALNAVQAVAACQKKQFDLVLIGAGLKAEAETDLYNQLKILHPNMKILYHYGGGSGLLFAEIQCVLK